MRRGVNKVHLMGNLGQDPQTRYSQNGGAVTTFRIGINSAWRDRNSNEMREETEWVSIVTYGRLAENVNQFLSKGSSVYVEGRIRTRNYEQDGVRKYFTEIVANEVNFLNNPRSAEGSGNTSYGRDSNFNRGGRSNQQARRNNQYQNEVSRADKDTGSDDEFGSDDSFEDDVPF